MRSVKCALDRYARALMNLAISKRWMLPCFSVPYLRALMNLAIVWRRRIERSAGHLFRYVERGQAASYTWRRPAQLHLGGQATSYRWPALASGEVHQCDSETAARLGNGSGIAVDESWMRSGPQTISRICTLQRLICAGSGIAIEERAATCRDRDRRMCQPGHGPARISDDQPASVMTGPRQ